MIKDYLNKNRIKITDIAKKTGIPYSTLNDLINNKISIDHIRFGNARALSRYLGVSMDALYEMGYRKIQVECGDGLEVFEKNGWYFLKLDEDPEIFDEPICMATEKNTCYLSTFATWKAEEIREKRKTDERVYSIT